MPFLPRVALFSTAALGFGLSLMILPAFAQGVPAAPSGETGRADPAPQTGATDQGAASAKASEADSGWQESTSLIGPSKYGKDFEHYDYVNPDAPVGGTLEQVAIGTYDSFNPFIVRGTPAAGFAAFGGGLLYDTLMDQSPDEPGTSHALIAEAVRYPADFSSVTYRLDPDAKWHDGEPITADDVIWSFQTLTEQYPLYNAYYRNVTKAEKTGEREVTFTFDQTGNRELPNIMGDLAVLPKHWWEGTDKNGKKRDISQPTIEPPLGSGPYKVARFQTGQSIRWERVADYWAKDKAVRVGRYNYGAIDYTYFRDANAAWEAFKKGGLDDYRVENRASRWAEGYDFPAVKNGQVVKKTFELDRIQPMQAYIMNLRLPKFQDRRVRQALTLAFNFEEMNRQVFYGAYTRTTSYFQNSELAASGKPEGKELDYLEPLRGKIPDEVFTDPFVLPNYSEPSSTREYLKRANDLLLSAGYERKGTRLVDSKTGQSLSIEFLGADPTSELIMAPFVRSLQRLGIQANINIVDPTQYIDRMRNFEFEITTDQFAQSESPGNEQRDFWSSQAAQTPGSRNTIGIENPAVDKLVDDIIYAPDRESLVAATRALDRVLLFEYYAIPQWFTPQLRLAYWTKLTLPEKQPGYSGVDPFSWWIGKAEEKAAGNAAPSGDQGAAAN